MNEVDFAKHGATVDEIDVAGLSDSALDALGLQGVPTLIARRNGAIVARAKGVMSPEEIEDFIQTAKEAR
jgi:protein-disulfide isomerase-like protein with CxxC motif